MQAIALERKLPVLNRGIWLFASSAVLAALLAVSFAGTGLSLSGSAPLTALALASGLVTAALTLLTPEEEWRQGGAFRLFLLEGCTLGLIFCQNLAVVSVLWALAPLVPYLGRKVERSRFGGVAFYYQMFSTALFLAAAGMSTAAYAPAEAAGALFALAAWIRLGAFPFHASALSVAGENRLTSALPWLSSQMGMVALVRFAAPLGAFDLEPASSIAMAAAGLGAIYFALLALVQRDPRRLVALISLGGTSLALVAIWHGLETIGAWQLFSVCVFTAGLGATAWLLRARFGSLEGGLSASAPNLGGFFLLFGLGATGIPGSLSFLTEDLVVGHTFSTKAPLGFALLAATALAAIAAYRLFVRIFQGTPSLKVPDIDLLPRERAGLVLLLLALLLPCLFAAL